MDRLRILASPNDARRITRRSLLAGVAVAGAGLALSGCSRGGVPSPAPDGRLEDQLNIYSWGDYDDPDNLAEFGRRGVTVQVDNFASNEELVAKLGAARGINVIGLVRRAAGVDELREQGIERVVSTDSDDWRDRVAELTGGAPIRVGIESVGGKAAGEVTSVLAEKGTLVVFGAMASPTLEIPSGDIIFKQVTVKGFWGSIVSREMPADQRNQLFGELIARALDGSLTLPVAATFGFDDIADAVAASGEPGRVGKVLLHP